MGERAVVDTDLIDPATEKPFCLAKIVPRTKIDSFHKRDKGV